MTGIRTHVAAALAVTLGLLTACGSDENSPSAADGDGGGQDEVTISVSNLPPTTEESAREAFLARVEEFEEQHPHVTVEPSEYEWDATTFAAQLAGGTLPTAFQFPFTDGQSLIARSQVADITDEVQALPYSDEFNPSVLDVIRDNAGQIYGIPIAAYGIGLHYNRTLFADAGLDPDQPPQSWDEVREYAQTISEETGEAGYAQMTQDNTGGWMLTTLTYALGGRMQVVNGDDVEVTIDNPQTRQALTMLQTMRWEDQSMGEDFLYDWGTINQAFAAGQIGMYMGGSDVYNSLVTENDINPDDYGLTVLPLDGDDAGVLGGGTIAGIRPDATAAEREAAVAWIDFYYMAKLTQQDAAVEDARTLADSGSPVGTPALPIFDAEQLAQAEEWVSEYVNVPQNQMSPFREQILDQPLIPEPPVKAQELYAELDAVVQSVLTDENADIDRLLETADQNVTDLVASA